MTVNKVDIEREETFTRFRIAQLAYDIYNIRVFGTANNEVTTFDELEERQKYAWAEAIDAAVEASSNLHTPRSDSISKKEEDNGYLVYNGCKEIRKLHPSLFTYKKFPEPVKEKYRDLAMKVYEKIDMEGGK